MSEKGLLLKKILKDFLKRNPFFVEFGVELEFYALKTDRSNFSELEFEEILKKIANYFKNDEIIYCAEREAGNGQIELKFSHECEIYDLAEKIIKTRNDLLKFADENNFIVDFSALPFENDCANALQVNISALDKDNSFKLKESVIASLLKFAEDFLFICVKEKGDLLRYDREINKNIFKLGKFTAPINSSCGVDNRSTMVRYFPDGDKKNKNRIEFRLPCADCDVFLLFSCLIFVVDYAIKNNLKIDENVKIFGNAFDQKYDLNSFDSDYEKIKDRFLKSEINQWLSKFI